MRAAKPVVMCHTCASWGSENEPCPCFTEGIQQRMTFEPQVPIAQYSDFMNFGSVIDETIIEMGTEIAEKLTASFNEIMKTTLPSPILTPAGTYSNAPHTPYLPSHPETPDFKNYYPTPFLNKT
jgi:hypothetical protein